jgi:MscS family membrane protein
VTTDRRRRVGYLVNALTGALTVLALWFATIGPAFAQADLPAIGPPPTDSPRATITALFSEVEQAFTSRAESDAHSLTSLLGHRVQALLDLDHVPPELRLPTAVETALKLYDILARAPLPSPDEIPDLATVRAAPLTLWAVPGTGLTLVDAAPGSGLPRFRFGPDTPEIADAIYPLIIDRPRRQGALGFDTFVVLRDGVGPRLTRFMGEVDGLVMPEWSRRQLLEVPGWKLVATLVLHLVALGVAALVVLAIRRTTPHQALSDALNPVTVTLALVLMPVAGLLQLVVVEELRLTGPILPILEVLWVGVFSIGAVLLAFALTRGAAGLFIRLARLAERPSDAHAARLVFRLLGLFMAFGILVNALDRLGVPVSGIIAGLGVGGIAVALAAQGTLQNLLGGASLLGDQPIRIGDFCRFGDRLGTLESIGLRSSRIRTLERTVVTVPNTDLAAMQIENFAGRDRILLKTTVGLRYETTPDQLRAVLADLRAMLAAHPEVSVDPARARFSGFGENALEIELFAYIRATDYNVYTATREDVMLRVMEIAARNGTSVAFPSRTVYLRPDADPDPVRRADAEAKVAGWRKAGVLPFPDMDSGMRGELLDTLPYPPEGSAQHRQQPGDP